MTSVTIKAYPRLREAEELLKKGRHDDASFVVIQHLRENRDEPRGLALLGEIAMEAGALVQAEEFLRRAIGLGNLSPESERNLATAILRQDRLEEALTAFTRLERQGGDLDVSVTRAMILDRLGRTEESIQAHEKIIARDPSEARYWIMYGHTLRFAGRTDDAIAAYRHVVERDPELGEAWWGLADIKSKVLTDADLGAMENALAVAVDILNIVPLHMALGRGLHDRGKYERAFAHYREGKRLRADVFKYDPAELTREVDEFIAMASHRVIEFRSESGEPVPIFLVSLPRSGSTLLEQMLDAHPEVEATGELPYIRALMRSLLEMRMTRGRVTVPELIRTLGEHEKRALGAEYLRRSAQHRRTQAPFFIDKMPSNWTDLLFIREILPQARFIEIRRNAMDCCFSNYVHHFGAAHAASFDLVHQARCCVDYTRLMNHISQVMPGLMCSLRYEDLVEEPEGELRKVLNYLGLEWTDDLLRFYESDRSIRTPSAEQVRRPVNRQGIGIWKPYAEWLGMLRDHLGSLADT